MIVLKFNGHLSAERLEHIRQQIDHALSTSKVIIVDRSVDVFIDGDSNGLTFTSDADQAS